MLTGKSYPDQTTTTFQHDENGNITTTANQHISYNYAYDAAGRVTGVTDSNGRSVSYAYDGNGNRTTMTAPEATTVTYAYDGAGRPTGITRGAETFTFAYDTNGRRATLTYPNGATATYTYDAKSRLTGLVHQTSGLVTIDSFTYTHDNVDNRLTKSEPDVSFSYTYDLTYRLTGSQPAPETSGVPSLIIEGFTYDQVGNRTTGPELVDTYAYDGAGRPTGITRGAETFSFAYDANGRRATLTYPNGATATYTYDAKSRLTGLVHRTSGLATIDSFTYTHDNVDNRLTKSEPDVSFSYSYDLVYRLTGSQPTPETPGVPSLTIEDFTYDQVGNRTCVISYSSDTPPQLQALGHAPP